MSHAACYVLLLAKGRGVEEVLLETVACVERAGEAGGGIQSGNNWRCILTDDRDRRQATESSDIATEQHSERVK